MKGNISRDSALGNPTLQKRRAGHPPRTGHRRA